MQKDSKPVIFKLDTIGQEDTANKRDIHNRALYVELTKHLRLLYYVFTTLIYFF